MMKNLNTVTADELDSHKFKFFVNGQAALQIHQFSHTANGRMVSLDFGFKGSDIKMHFVAGRMGRIDTLDATRNGQTTSLPKEFRRSVLHALRQCRRDIEGQVSAEIALAFNASDLASGSVSGAKMPDFSSSVAPILAAELLRSFGFSPPKHPEFSADLDARINRSTRSVLSL